jgi:hypothetical protein
LMALLLLPSWLWEEKQVLTMLDLFYSAKDNEAMIEGLKYPTGTLRRS